MKMILTCYIKKFKKVIYLVVVMLAIVMTVSGCGSVSIKKTEEITMALAPTVKLTQVPTPIPEEAPTAIPTQVPTAVPTMAPISELTTAPMEDEAFSYTSPDGKYTAIVKDGIIIEVINVEGEIVAEYNVEDGSANSIMSFGWFKNNLLSICAHVNPSTSYFCVYDVEQKQILVEKYGGLFMFTDDENYKSLIYTQVPPHFSDEKHIERIRDINDKVLYEAPENMIIYGLCQDDETGDLAFTTQGIDRENNYLTVLFKADNSQWSTPLGFSGNIESFKDGYINVMNGSEIVVFYAGQETLEDLSAFLPLQDCFLDYAFQVEKIGTADYRTSYTVNGNYDLNSDGKVDSISVLQKGRYNNLSYIEVNQIKLSFNVDNPYDGEVHIIDLDKNDPYLEVASFDDGPSGDPEYTFFRYDGSSIYKLGHIDAYASIDGEGRLISSFHRNNYFKPKFCSAWYEITNNVMVRKNNNIDRYLGQMYDFSGGEAYFLPYEELPENPDIRWDEMKHFEACKVKLIDIWGLGEGDRTLNYYYIELPTGETGLIYFWIGD